MSFKGKKRNATHTHTPLRCPLKEDTRNPLGADWIQLSTLYKSSSLQAARKPPGPNPRTQELAICGNGR